MTEYVAFVGLVAVVVLIPGPAVVLVMQKAVTTGLRGALLVALGVLTADLVWAAAAAVGVTAVLVASEPAFLALRLIGAAYLVYLGARLLFARRHALPQPDLNTPRVPVRPLVAFRQGFLCDMTNPKTALVFTSVIPQFLPTDSLTWPPVLGVTFAVLGFLSLLVYAFTFTGAKRVLRRPVLQRRLLRTSGGVLIGFGVTLAAESH